MFMMNCNNKGCGKYQSPVLNTKDNEIYCTECGNKIAGASHFTKVQLKALGQTKKPVKTAYSIRCEKCKQEGMPKFAANNKDLVCSSCDNILKNISEPFAILIRKAIEKGNQDL
jgi:ribosomal protein L34E